MQTKKTLRVGIVVGEHSGDLLGSELIKSLKNDNDIELYGIGGPKLSDLGLNSEFDFKKINVMGLICLLYTSPSPRDRTRSRMPSSA